MKFLLGLLLVSTSAFASIDGKFYAEYSKKDMSCALLANISQKNLNQLTLHQWDEGCEDQNGNTYESSLEDVTTYEKISSNQLKITQGKDEMILDAKILEFSDNFVHYDFEVDIEDGHLEINESFKLEGTQLHYSSVYILDGVEVINNSGILFQAE